MCALCKKHQLRGLRVCIFSVKAVEKRVVLAGKHLVDKSNGIL